MPLKLSKQNLSIGVICSKQKHRPALCGLYLDPQNKTITATDSYRLIRMQLEEVDDAIMINEKYTITPSHPLIIPAESAKSAKAKIRKTSLPDFEGCFFLSDNIVASTDLTTAEITQFQKVEEEYPDVDKVINEAKAKDGKMYIKVNAKLLADTLKAFAEASGEHVVLKFTDESDAIIITNAKAEDGAIGLVMPERY